MPIITPRDLSRLTPSDVRMLCRRDRWPLASTAGVCDGFVQANLLVLPNKYAKEFREFAHANPISCPVLYETPPGNPSLPSYLTGGPSTSAPSDLRIDLPSYSIYTQGSHLKNVQDLIDHWNEDSVGFLIGCSYSFETVLVRHGLTPRHVELGRNVPMYRTTQELIPVGRFHGTTIVSLRPYHPRHLPLIHSLTAPFLLAHSSPIAYGPKGATSLGINDVLGQSPDYGDPTRMLEDEVGVYWACGVTAQEIVMRCLADEQGVHVYGHEPGKMLVLDLRNEQICTGGDLIQSVNDVGQDRS